MPRNVIVRRPAVRPLTAEEPLYDIYVPSVLSMRVQIPMPQVGRQLHATLEREVARRVEGRCIAEGYVRAGSVKLLTHSSGTVLGVAIEFAVSYQCDVCYPTEGMLIECDVKTVTKAGIHAEKHDADGRLPIVVFVSRDHHHDHEAFAAIQEKTKIRVKILGVRFELHDTHLSALATL